jgi:hypothetical protein
VNGEKAMNMTTIWGEVIEDGNGGRIIAHSVEDEGARERARKGKGDEKYLGAKTGNQDLDSHWSLFTPILRSAFLLCPSSFSTPQSSSLRSVSATYRFQTSRTNSPSLSLINGIQKHGFIYYHGICYLN